MLAISWAIVMLVDGHAGVYDTYFMPNIALPQLHGFASHWWTIFTYGIFHFAPSSFFELLSNMLWLYCFGSVTQMLIGKKQIIPLFIYSLLAGGALYLGVQFLPGEFGHCPPQILGPRAALVGMAAAAITLSPHYRFYLTETFSVPMMVVAGIFGVLMILGSGFYLPVIIMLAGGGLMGFGYVKLLKAGHRPGQWMYSIGNKLESMVTPDEHAISRNNKRRNAILSNMKNSKSGISQQRVDDILDKINQKGYDSLTAEEKDTLTRAGKE